MYAVTADGLLMKLSNKPIYNGKLQVNLCERKEYCCFRKASARAIQGQPMLWLKEFDC